MKKIINYASSLALGAILLGCSTTNLDFGYRKGDESKKRLNALSELAKSEGNVDYSIPRLKRILVEDKDSNVKRLVGDMINSYNKSRTFCTTGPYIEMIAERENFELTSITNHGYHKGDIWYTRRWALDVLALQPEIIDENIVQDLRRIARNDSDWRVQRVAAGILKKCCE